MHGRGLICFRTFHNLSNTSNVQIHTFLLALEAVYKAEGNHLPDTIYYQVDGGAENVAKPVLAMCELIIARGLTKRIVFSRLMVGHTHADIDAVFGRLWKSVRNAHVNTPQEYQNMIESSLSLKGIYDAKVHDLFTVPDYSSLLRPVMGSIRNYCKGDQTQLQFTFEAVEPSVNFPLGCKTTYRAFSKDQVMEIVSDPSGLYGMSARNVNVRSFPEKTEEGRIEGE